jgi:hypothetical protein
MDNVQKLNYCIEQILGFIIFRAACNYFLTYSVVGWGTLLQAGRSRAQFPMSLDFSIDRRPNPSSRTMALGSTQPLTEMSTRNVAGGKGRPAPEADNLTAICELIV